MADINPKAHEHHEYRQAIRELCGQFDSKYWQEVEERNGYPDAFVRMWDFYLSYCEGGCRERQMGDLQLLLTKPQCRLSVPA